MSSITPFLWFDTQAKEAAEFYVSLFPNSEITNISYAGDPAAEDSPVFSVSFVLDRRTYIALNGGPTFTLNEAFSLLVNCDGQDEIDFYWSKLTEGGEESQCGWLKDRFGLSWQIVPHILGELLGDPDPDRAERARQAMLAMTKLDIDALRAAAGATE